ncbi:4-alpha-glucanotransferase [Planktothrix sp. FACHB-1365]|uniref:4-alpha-glucanotransferase n=1 Tax=Planktothrix sp. FACHB-1365 TaxID=2692855 RepID=UPI0016871092|nr:4-alpha-glucanotransferase [Planktothrix sp. FACHB-1365]MBD2484677.1 4-alpha-glucanotransferase [Planktothrix sp. FACHB-1365]
MPFPRSSGILLHPTSLPSPFGVGDIGPVAYQFIDFLRNSAQQLWQVLPLGPTGFGNSPYLSYSAFAGNPLLISLELLKEDELLTDEDLANPPKFPSHIVNFDAVKPFKDKLFQKACKAFKENATSDQEKEFNHFCSRSNYWLDDYAIFMALKEALNGESWNQWDEDIARRKQEALHKWGEKLAEPIYYHKFLQFQFFKQWGKLKLYANEQGIQLFGDLAIYVAHDSADVWSHPEIFSLDGETGEASLMAGVPPDYFSATGQLWGNPVYNWERLQQEGFHWWIQRVESLLGYLDLIRIDHFRGLESYWGVAQGETTAINGRWIEAPGDAFFSLLNEKLGTLPIIAEDLGIITPEVEELRDKYGFPGMKILHFAFDSGPDNPYLPYNYNSANWVVYTGTHDNDTTVGWFNRRTLQEQARVTRYLGCTSDYGIHWDLIRLAMSCVANQAIFPLQDILGLGSEAKMNMPGEAEGNWAWRFQPGMLTEEIAERLKFFTETYGRQPRNQ